MSDRRPTLLLACAACAGGPLLLGGCVERTIHITSEPPGALVWLNDREIGRTPIEVGFVHYGTYDVRLVREGYEPLLTAGEAQPPWWDNVPLDLAAELAPGTQESRIHWHYELVPRNDDRDDLLGRAGDLRRLTAGEADEAATTAGEAPEGD